jgi:hypothetical protein
MYIIYAPLVFYNRPFPHPIAATAAIDHFTGPYAIM